MCKLLLTLFQVKGKAFPLAQIPKGEIHKRAWEKQVSTEEDGSEQCYYGRVMKWVEVNQQLQKHKWRVENWRQNANNIGTTHDNKMKEGKENPN